MELIATPYNSRQYIIGIDGIAFYCLFRAYIILQRTVRTRDHIYIQGKEEIKEKETGQQCASVV